MNYFTTTWIGLQAAGLPATGLSVSGSIQSVSGGPPVYGRVPELCSAVLVLPRLVSPGRGKVARS